MYKSDNNILGMKPAYLIDQRSYHVVAELKPSASGRGICHFDPWHGEAIPELVKSLTPSSMFWLVAGFAFSEKSGVMLQKFSDVTVTGMEHYVAVDKQDFDLGLSAEWLTNVRGYGWYLNMSDAQHRQQNERNATRRVDLTKHTTVLYNRQIIATLPPNTLEDYRGVKVMGILTVDQLAASTGFLSTTMLPVKMLDEQGQPFDTDPPVLTFDLHTGEGIVPKKGSCTYVHGWAVVNSANLDLSGRLLPDPTGPYAECTVPAIPMDIAEENRAVIEQLQTAANALLNALKLLPKVNFGPVEKDRRVAYCCVRDGIQYTLDDTIEQIASLSVPVRRL